uniref:Uncharacterized protein n=1 Tax=Chromera velia CCMP2878 TaxID=1169474 RepID=A0A0G4F1M3_9ALVE|eukprot:Cvel_14594.t1-p1 / transcript=Cvel_14594.t1 / gene=Cvel_14594 / organism=Chromera_velia_CCMP2878 / gene_product=Ankyrin repeat and protein kinase domain-containing, putative / transcript_product=Ankyrin repeat and protein kinase domain-containing, putative / location=Cvel_scaffold1043:50673-52046(+) / protein_length=458 / sequence_SO=supercontig / SO=protein_coding / is_pseudo=false
MARIETPTANAYLERLDSLEVSLFASLRQQFEIVRKTVKAKSAGSSHAADAAATAASAPASLFMHSEDVVVIDELEEMGKEFSKKVKEGCEKVVRRHIQIDVGYLIEVHLGHLIHDFRAVSAEPFQEALSDYLNGGDGSDFRLCLQVGADVDGLEDGQAALMKAVLADHEEACRMLLDDGADLEVRAGELPPMNESEEEEDLILSVAAGDTVLIAACRRRLWGKVRFLIAEGADVNAQDANGRKALQIACEAAERQFDPHVADRPEWLHDQEYDPEGVDPSLRLAVRAALKDLLLKTSEIDQITFMWPAENDLRNGETLVHFFMWHGFHDLFELAVSQGLSVDAQSHERDELADLAFTPLHLMAMARRPDAVEFLLSKGANVDIRRGGGDFESDTPLHDAVSGSADGGDSQGRVVEILLEHGADLNAAGFEGYTAIHYAALFKNPNIVKLLLDRGAEL